MNVITSTGPDVVASPRTTPRRGRLALAAVATVALACGATVAVLDQGSQASRPSTTVAQLAQDRATKADRLFAQVDGATDPSSTDLSTMGQIHQVTGATAGDQQARTQLYQQLRNG